MTQGPAGKPGAAGWLHRIAWFIALWGAGVAAVGLLAYAIRLILSG